MNASDTYRRVQDPVALKRADPLHIEPAIPEVFASEAKTYSHSPEAGVYELSQAHVDALGACRDRLARRMPWNERSLPVGQSEAAAAWNPTVWFKHPMHLAETVGALTHPNQKAYFHWLFDVLPRYALLEKLSFVPDRLYVDQSLEFQRQSWARLDVRAEIIDSSLHPNVQAGRLLVPSAPSTSGVMPPWVCQWLRRRLGSPPRGRNWGRRIYVSRAIAGRGTVVNEDAVQACLQTHGFEAVHSEELSVANQIEMFADAEFVIGPHGAGLANVLFANPGCTVIELFTEEYINVCYWTLCCQLGLRYAFLMTRGQAGRSATRPDLVVDMSKLERLLDLVLNDRPSTAYRQQLKDRSIG
jgi:hypothetical protein